MAKQSTEQQLKPEIAACADFRRVNSAPWLMLSCQDDVTERRRGLGQAGRSPQLRSVLVPTTIGSKTPRTYTTVQGSRIIGK